MASFLRARSGACKRRSRLFSVHTTPVVHCVITPAATALSLLPRGEAPSGEVGAPTRDAPGRVSAVSLCVSEALAALAALALHWVFRATYVFTDTRIPQSSVMERALDTSRPRATDTVKWG